MREELLSYYERELTYLRQLGAEFAARYPKIASRLMLESDRCEDPHVERLLEAFAFLAARVHLKLDDDFPEISSALLQILYPHYVRPIPSMSIAQFEVDPDHFKVTTGLSIPRGSILYSNEVDGLRCKFRTCYDTVLLPLSITEVQYVSPDHLQPALKVADAVAAIRVSLQCFPDVTFEKLTIPLLSFYLDGDTNLVHTLYELLCNNCIGVCLRDPTPRSKVQPVMISGDMMSPRGFAETESMLPYTRRSFSGYRILQEYFSLPEKFFFFELKGLEVLSNSGLKERAEIIFLISRFERDDRKQILELGVGPTTVRLGCTPIVNLFNQTAEPILLDQAHYEYPVVPDVRRQTTTEIFSVDEVLSTHPDSREPLSFEPFYGRRYRADSAPSNSFWHAVRRSAATRSDARTDVFITLVDLSGKPVQPDADTLTVRCTCTNFTAPAKLTFGAQATDFELEGIAAVTRVKCLRKPTATLRPPTGKGMLWRLVGHLSLNYLSLVDEGRDALQRILEIYNFSDSSALRNYVGGIIDLHSARHFACIRSDGAVAPVRGTRVEMRFDEDRFVGGGVYLFASVLEHFLGAYVSMNSFSQLVASTQQRKELLREWPPRAGQLILM